MFSSSDGRDGRAGTPLLQKPSRTPSPPSGLDRGRPGHRTPRRLSAGSHGGDSATTSAARAAYTHPSAPALHHGHSRSRNSRRRNTLRSRSPASNDARLVTRRKYTYAAIFLVLTLVSFTAQTELAAWVQRAGWDKAYCMMYVTHGSWTVLWPAQLLVLRAQKRSVPWHVFWRRHAWLLRTTASMVERQDLDAAFAPLPHSGAGKQQHRRPWVYMARATAFITLALTVAGLSWYVAVNMTSPSDLTAIYNCSAFFAYAFSVPLLKERLRLDKSLAVLIAIAGVLVVAYGDSKGTTAAPGGSGPGDDPGRRFLGNVIIGAGSVLYGLYEVLYKRYACPPEGCSPGRGMIFANTFGSLMGLFTLTVLWIPLPVLHVLGIETFVLPRGMVAWYLFLSVVMGAIFAGSFLVLISLTSPVLSSVASLLTIFLVAVCDWFVTGEPLSGAAVAGGGMIVVAFAMLSWSTYREMAEDERNSRKKEDDFTGDEDEDEDDQDDEDESGDSLEDEELEGRI